LCDPRIVKEEQNEHFAEVGFDHAAGATAVPRQLCIMFDSIRLQGTNASERTKVIACLANLLMQAAGVMTEERENDER
jgi:hypothetical protein